MTKSEFIQELSKKTSLTKSKADETLKAMLEIIVDSCRNSQGVKLPGFGTFVPFHAKASKRMNPQTGKQMDVPARWVPKFRASSTFKRTLNG